MLNYDFLNCSTSGVACKASVWSFRINSTLKAEGKEFWYRDKLDYSRADTSPTVDIDTNDVVNDGDPRAKQSINFFTEGQDFSINEDCNSAFLQRIHEIWVLGTDEQRKQFLESGIDIKKETFFGDLSYTEEVWECVGFTAFEPAFRKQEVEDATVDFSVIFQNEPTVKNVGFTSKLPAEAGEPVSADISITSVPPLTIEVDVQNIVDEDNLIENDTFNVSIYDSEGLLTQSNNYQSTDFPISELLLADGTYTVVVSYLFSSDPDLGDVFKVIAVQEIETLQSATGQILSDGGETQTAVSGTYDYTANDESVSNASIVILDGATEIETISTIVEGSGTAWASSTTLTANTTYTVELRQDNNVLSSVSITTLV